MNSEAKTYAPEQTEPKAALVPVPVIIFVVLGLLFYWGTLYLDRNAGGFKAQVYQPYASLKDLQDHQPKGDNDQVLVRGKKLYTDICLPCHQATGLGAPGMAPALAGSEWVLTPGPGRMARIAFNGVQGPISIKGVEFTGPNTAMPAMGIQTGLSDEDMAALLTYIRTNKDWGNNAPAVKPEQIKALRPVVTARGEQWTSDELKQVPEAE
jgi:mono/diheme cytochrome c family protein